MSSVGHEGLDSRQRELNAHGDDNQAHEARKCISQESAATVTAATNSRIAFFAGPSFHEGNGSAAFEAEQRQIAKITEKPEIKSLNLE